MLVSVETAIADVVNSKHLKDDYIIPKVDDPQDYSYSYRYIKNRNSKSYG